MCRLTIIISTLNEGIFRMESAINIVHPQIKYLIIHQNTSNVNKPAFLERPDIEVITTNTKGLSKSRNIGLKNCKTEYAIIGDDDLEYIVEGLINVLEIIKIDSPDFASFKIQTPSDELEFKEYPTEKLFFKDSHITVASIEMLINVEKIKQKNIAFDERFGLGTYLRQSEEEIFISDLTKNGLNGIYYPIFIVKHPYESTGTKPVKESFKYFLKGCVSERLGEKYKLPKFNSFLRYLKNTIFLHMGRIYIAFTKRSYL